MDTENSNSSPKSERDTLNEQLDELRRQNQQEHELNSATHSRLGRLLGFLGIGGALLFWGTSCNKLDSMVTCYIICDPSGASKKSEIQTLDPEQYSDVLKKASQQDTPESNEEQNDSNENQKE